MEYMSCDVKCAACTYAGLDIVKDDTLPVMVTVRGETSLRMHTYTHDAIRLNARLLKQAANAPLKRAFTLKPVGHTAVSHLWFGIVKALQQDADGDTRPLDDMVTRVDDARRILRACQNALIFQQAGKP